MLLLRVIQPGREPLAQVVDVFPFRLGRSSEADLQLDAPGVWDIHLLVELKNGRFAATPVGDAILLHNDAQSAGATLKSGDRLGVGACQVAVSLAPATQRHLLPREAFSWFLILLVALLQGISIWLVR